jgi:hypothetical protein
MNEEIPVEVLRSDMEGSQNSVSYSFAVRHDRLKDNRDENVIAGGSKPVGRWECLC